MRALLLSGLFSAFAFASVGVPRAAAQCGNGAYAPPGEECDDGNMASGDGCDDACRIEPGYSCINPPSLTGISEQNYPGASASWTVSGDGLSGIQTANTGAPTIGLIGADAQAITYTFDTTVETTSDDDFIGFVLGFDPGEQSDAAADYLLIDWKQATQSGGTIGMALSRVTGIPRTAPFQDFWNHTTGPSGAVTEIRRAAVFGSVGWADNARYRWNITYTPTNLTVTVQQQTPVLGPVIEVFNEDSPGGEVWPAGEIGFYGFSQENVRYTVILPPPSECDLDADDDQIFDDEDWDADNDGIPDDIELPGFAADPDSDTDGDGVPDWNDPDHNVLCTGDGGAPERCAALDPTQDVDGDGLPNHLDLDSDGDSIPDVIEAGYGANAGPDGRIAPATDSDRDGLADVADETPTDPTTHAPAMVPPNSDPDPSPDYLDGDADGDGLGDRVEAQDVDGDGTLGGGEAGPAGNDHDGDGLDDAYDVDCVAVGTPPGCMAAGTPTVLPFEPYQDEDADGVPDWLETCGDAYVRGAEVCDDGNTVDDDACSNMCLSNLGGPCTDDTQCAAGVCNPDTGTCQPCRDDMTGGTDSGCTDPAPACVVMGTTAGCLPCEDDQPGGAQDDGCGADAPVCDGDTNSCVVCDDTTVGGQDDGCAGAAPVCDTTTPGGTCVACENDDPGTGSGDTDFGCGPGAPFCQASPGMASCIECVGAANCADGNDCTSDVCDPSGACVNDPEPRGTACPVGDACDGASMCVECVDDEATATDSGCDVATPFCDESGAAPTCLECLGNGDCEADEFCNPAGTCAPGCDSDDDCGDDVCDVPNAVCVPCLDSAAMGVDSGCDAATPVCLGAAGSGTGCGECDAVDVSACGSAEVCAPTNTCVTCFDDATGIEVDSGCAEGAPVCDTATAAGECVECLVDTHCPGLEVCAMNVCGAPDTDGDGVPDDMDIDDDGDGILDSDETGGDDRSIDSDGDGVPDYTDPDVVACDDVDANGICDTLPASVDLDGDGLPNHLDLDADGDGIPDATEGHDADGDGVPDTTPPTELSDMDMDGLHDAYDPDHGGSEAPRQDTDGDTRPDFLDGDSDDDGLPDHLEAFDLDGDGQQDVRRSGVDSDGDGIDDAFDPDAGGASPVAADVDDDGRPAYLDLDADGDGLAEFLECEDPTDCPDTDGDGLADYLDPDSDGDGIADAIEGTDLDADGAPDLVASGTDADGDGLDDAFDPDAGGERPSLPDRDADGIPDRRDTDDDGDGAPSIFECPDASDCPDTDMDGTPDYLDPDDGPLDSDMDGIPDDVECGGDIAGCVDTDGDGDPDHLDDDDDGDGVPTADECPGGPAACDPDDDGRPSHLDLDSDDDGITDAVECGALPCVDTDRDGVVDRLDLDSDGDGIPDATEGHDVDADGAPDVLPLGVDVNMDGLDDAYDEALGVPAPTPDTDDDGTPDWRDPDDDGDGIASGLECPNPAAGCPDEDSDGRPDYLDADTAPTDTDGDGIPDVVECSPPSDPVGDPLGCPDTDGDGRPNFDDPDDDGDGIPTAEESYDGDGDPTDDDSDGDGVPDYLDTDDDNDGVPTAMECADFEAGCEDTDGDGRPDYLDVCGDGVVSTWDDVTAWEQCDDGNHIAGDGCDPTCRVEMDRDSDGDGLFDSMECPAPGNPASPTTCRDTDGDGRPDFLDPDDDDDGVPTADELAAGPAVQDSDGDGVSDHLDPDDDGDGVPTLMEIGPGGAADPRNTDGDDQPDYLDTDDDNDTIPTADELDEGLPRDTDGDGEFDHVDDDDDGDGILTADEIRAGRALEPPSDDLDDDGAPHWLDTDADGDGILDADEPDDADGDGVPDYLQPNETDPEPTVGGYAGGACAAGGRASGFGLLLLLGLAPTLGRRRRR